MKWLGHPLHNPSSPERRSESVMPCFWQMVGVSALLLVAVGAFVKTLFDVDRELHSQQEDL